MIEPAAIAVQREPHVAIPGATVADAWAGGWARWERGGHRALGWTGYTGGQRAYLRVFPEQDAALVLLTNAAGPLLGGSGGSALYDDLLPRLLEQLGRAAPRRAVSHRRPDARRRARGPLRPGCDHRRRRRRAAQRRRRWASTAPVTSARTGTRSSSRAVRPAGSRSPSTATSCTSAPSHCRARRKLLCSVTTFKDLGLSETILDALKDVGYESPSPIQEQAIPELLQGHDVIGQAQTGTGKTAAFGLPMIQFVDPDDPDVQALGAHADARALHPGDAGPARLRQAQGHPARRRLRRRADPHPAGAAQGGRADRGRHGRPRARPDLAPLADAALVPLPRPRRGRRDARPRLPRGRREDPLAHAGRPPDRAVQRDDAAGDPRRSPTATSTTR